MVKTAPLRISGSRHEGFVLDYHTVSSKPMGYDSYGHLVFDTTYTPIGQLLYLLKSNGDVSVVDEIVETAVDFLRKWALSISELVPVPPSNTTRRHQPVSLIGKRIADSLGIDWFEDAIIKVKQTPQLKDIFDTKKRTEILSDAFRGSGVRKEHPPVRRPLSIRCNHEYNRVAAI